MREKIGFIGVFALVAAIWAAGYLWQTGRIDLSSGPAEAGSAAPPAGTPVPATRETPGSTPSGPDQEVEAADPDRRGVEVTASTAQERATQARAAQARAAQARAAQARAAQAAQYRAAEDRAAQGPAAQDPVFQGPAPLDPAAQARAAQDRAERFLQGELPVGPPPTLQLRVATFNVLGASHTAGRTGPRFRGFASGVARVSGILQVLASRQIDVAGLQEFQPVQRAAFARRASGWSTYPGGRAFDVGTTSVAWRTDRFELVEGRLSAMPFYGTSRAVPSVLLRERDSGVQVWVSTAHNPANTGKYPRQQGAREIATARQVALVRQLGAAGVPVIITGDMNEKDGYYCRFTSRTGFTSPAGGSRGGAMDGRGCRPPGRSAIDWILGSPALQWTSYSVDRSSLVRRTTDHPVRVAGVRIDAADFPGSWGPGAGPR